MLDGTVSCDAALTVNVIVILRCFVVVVVTGTTEITKYIVTMCFHSICYLFRPVLYLSSYMEGVSSLHSTPVTVLCNCAVRCFFFASKTIPNIQICLIGQIRNLELFSRKQSCLL